MAKIEGNPEQPVLGEDGEVLLASYRDLISLRQNGAPESFTSGELGENHGMNTRFGGLDEMEAAICESVRGSAMPCIFDEIDEE